MDKQRTLKERRNEAEKIVNDINEQLKITQIKVEKALDELKIATKTKNEFRNKLCT